MSDRCVGSRLRSAVSSGSSTRSKKSGGSSSKRHEPMAGRADHGEAMTEHPPAIERSLDVIGVGHRVADMGVAVVVTRSPVQSGNERAAFEVRRVVDTEGVQDRW